MSYLCARFDEFFHAYYIDDDHNKTPKDDDDNETYALISDCLPFGKRKYIFEKRRKI